MAKHPLAVVFFLTSPWSHTHFDTQNRFLNPGRVGGKEVWREGGSQGINSDRETVPLNGADWR